MKYLALRKILTGCLLLSLTACAVSSTSDTAVEKIETSSVPAFIANAQAEKPFAEHKLVLQLSNQERQTDVLDVANNLIKNFGGPEYIDIEIVTFNEGVKLLYADSPHLDRVDSLVENGVRFSVCKNTIDSTERRTGVRPQLSEHADMVQAGVARVIALVENGYVNIKP